MTALREPMLREKASTSATLSSRSWQRCGTTSSSSHRGRDIRLNTKVILTYGIRTPETATAHAANLGRQKRCREVHKKRLPVCSAGGDTLTANHAMALIRRQKRRPRKENDYIFSILGLFSNEVQHHPPIFVYARVATGNIMALFMDEDQNLGVKGHSISNVPSWLPRIFAQMSYQEAPPGAHVRVRWPDPQRPHVENAGTIAAKTSYYRINGLRRSNATNVANSTSQQNHPGDGDGKVHGFTIASGGDRTPLEIEQDDIILEIQVLPSMTVDLYFKSRLTRGEMAAWRLLKKAIDAGKAVMACVKTSKHIHHWLNLVANVEAGTTWKIVGHLKTGHIHEGINWNGENAPLSFQFHIN